MTVTTSEIPTDARGDRGSRRREVKPSRTGSCSTALHKLRNNFYSRANETVSESIKHYLTLGSRHGGFLREEREACFASENTFGREVTSRRNRVVRRDRNSGSQRLDGGENGVRGLVAHLSIDLHASRRGLHAAQWLVRLASRFSEKEESLNGWKLSPGHFSTPRSVRLASVRVLPRSSIPLLILFLLPLRPIPRGAFLSLFFRLVRSNGPQ